MSLAKTLIKVAIGVALAKGVSTLAKKSGGGATASNPGTGAPYDGRPKSGLEDIFQDALGNAPGQPRRQGGTASGGSLEDLLGGLTGNGAGKIQPRQRANAPKGGLEDILGGMLGGGQTGGAAQAGPGGGLGDLLGSLLGAAAGGKAAGNMTGAGNDSGSIFGNATASGRDAAADDAMAQGRAKGPMKPTSRHDDLSAALILRAMIQAAKADGDLDQAEKDKLLKNMGEASPDEIAFVKAELQRPVDIKGLAGQVPSGMEEQIYAMSLLAINLDSQPEARYLHDLATALELNHAEVNALHDKVGAPHIYS